MTAYRKAAAVQMVADDLIFEHYPELDAVGVRCVFIDKTAKSKGREVWARAKKVGGLNGFLAYGEDNLPDSYSEHEFFVIEVSEEKWERLKAPARRAMIDQQLSSCEIEHDEETGFVKGLAVVGPDVAVNREIVERHGLWFEELAELVEAGAEQLTLDQAISVDSDPLNQLKTSTGELQVSMRNPERVE